MPKTKDPTPQPITAAKALRKLAEIVQERKQNEAKGRVA